MNNYGLVKTDSDTTGCQMNRLFFLLMFLLATGGQVVAQEGLIAYYPFNGNGNDESNNSNDLIVKGPTLIADRFNKPDSAYRFDGHDDYMLIPYNAGLRPPSFAATVWIKVEKLPEVGKYILTTSADTKTPPYDPFRLRLKVSGKIEARYEGDNDSIQLVLDSNSMVKLGKWHFIATCYDEQNGDAVLYFDGKLEVESNAPMTLDTNDYDAVIGAGMTASGLVDTTTFFRGCIDDIRLFNRGLSRAEIHSFFVEGTKPTKKIEELGQNFPNPFNSRTSIDYTLAATAHVVIKVYNTVGQKIRTLADETQTAGPYTVQWDGTDENNRKINSGLYIYQVIAGDQSETRKMLLIR
jgi:hypothetical protein